MKNKMFRYLSKFVLLVFGGGGYNKDLKMRKKSYKFSTR